MTMRKARSIQERLWPKVRKTEGCWLWTAGTTKAGYGQISSGPRVNQTMFYAHRLVYELLVGPIPDGLELDHLCRNRACVNPEHLEPVTHVVNCRRGICGPVNAARQLARTHCRNGHPLDGDNLFVNVRGHRVCRICARAANTRAKAIAAGKGQ